ncbi:Holliday junction resolvase RuvX [Campylobacter geochelonis]|uniref:Holliday junction resolvase-like protein n=1 Tax=Campylobacter geochelonis TaxID=1780362 RepID=A0A128EGA0_9BACT|nr:Holliday junction resolvase RuvX [Campylobacter geochelonis]QKF71011.1 Holliday junction resolvase-like protein (UPF0081 domain) [Campylobacter geochelonis]CZE47152.1 Holliday junction resolvase-like protein [Campylobacter geochelonis]CZE47627.1 Holliday junction resolvase-like protein [Campylobacter geochelonis]CZE50173.1 Holliday junction resolvase-like protein [Campylobacter geochelonis]
MIVAIDIGLKRIGVAIGYENGVVMPQNAILRKNRNQAATAVDAVLSEFGANKLVVGVPLGGSSEGEMRRRVEHFVGLLEFGGEVCYIDESFSSVEAGEFGVANHKKKDGKLDSLAAMVILKRYLGVL